MDFSISSVHDVSLSRVYLTSKPIESRYFLNPFTAAFIIFIYPAFI